MEFLVNMDVESTATFVIHANDLEGAKRMLAEIGSDCQSIMNRTYEENIHSIDKKGCTEVMYIDEEGEGQDLLINNSELVGD